MDMRTALGEPIWKLNPQPSSCEAALWNFTIFCRVKHTHVCVGLRATREPAATTSWGGWQVRAAKVSCGQWAPPAHRPVRRPPGLFLNVTDGDISWSRHENGRRRRRLESWRPAVCTELLMFGRHSSWSSARFRSMLGCVRGVAREHECRSAVEQISDTCLCTSLLLTFSFFFSFILDSSGTDLQHYSNTKRVYRCRQNGLKENWISFALTFTFEEIKTHIALKKNWDVSLVLKWKHEREITKAFV